MLLEDVLEEALEGARWFSVIHAHNETGVVQSLKRLHAACRKHGVLLHADASQSAGKIPLESFDLLTLAAHKLYGPKGVGALIRTGDVELHAQQLGAGHEHGLRAGTENVASIVGFGAACVAAKRDLDSVSARLRVLQQRLETKLINDVPGLIIAGAKSTRLPNTTYALFPGVSGSELLAKTEVLAASTGSACHQRAEVQTEDPASVLLEMRVDRSLALGAVRLTSGRHTTEENIDLAATSLARTWRALKR